MNKFQKGHKKLGGRKKGTPNKTNSHLREWIGKFLDENREQIEEDFKELKPSERANIYAKLLEYHLPKLSRVETKELTSIELLLLMSPEERELRIKSLKNQLRNER